MKYLAPFVCFFAVISLSGQNIRFVKGLPETSMGAGYVDVFLSGAEDIDEDRFVFSTLDNANHNYDLWISSGDIENTFKVKNLNGKNSGFPTGMTAFKSKVIFSAFDTSTGRELWITDGTVRGTKLLKDINPGTANSSPQQITKVGNKIIFTANDGVHGQELWETDGTTDGTKLIKDINTTGYAFYPGEDRIQRPFQQVDGKIYFSAYTNSSTQSLIQSDGTYSGTLVLANNVDLSLFEPIRKMGENKMIFVARSPSHGEELWITDGTASGTQMLEISPGAFSYLPRQLTVADGKLFFTATKDIIVRKLWVTDGTLSGTHEIAGLAYKDPASLRFYKGMIYLVAKNASNELSIYRTNDTGAESKKIIDLEYNSTNIFTVYKDKLYYSVAGLDHTASIWFTDGNTENLLYRFPVNSSSGSMYLVNNFLLLDVATKQNGFEWWKTDGTMEGTHLLKDINPGPPSSVPTIVKVLKNKILFRAKNEFGYEQWITDGTTDGTKFLGDLNQGKSNYAKLQWGVLTGIFENQIIALDDSLRISLWNPVTETSTAVFEDNDLGTLKDVSQAGQKLFYTKGDRPLIIDQLWSYDGINKTKVKIVEDSVVDHYGSVNDKLIFSEIQFGGLSKVKSSNGESMQTLIGLTDYEPLPLGEIKYRLNSDFADKFYFLMQKKITKETDIWITDGEPNGTFKLFTIPKYTYYIHSINSEPFFMTSLYPNKGFDVWKIDKVSHQKISLTSFSSWGSVISNVKSVSLHGKNYLFFSSYPTLFYETDGTPLGTVLIGEIPGTIDYEHIVASEKEIFFINTTAEYGTELWKTDGTLIGTKIIKDIAPGTNSSMGNTALAILNGKVFFQALTNNMFSIADVYNIPTWVTDGTLEGTRQLTDINATESISGPYPAAVSLPDRIYMNGVSFRDYGLFEITYNTPSIEMWINNTLITRNGQFDWDYVSSGSELTGTLIIKNTGDQDLIIKTLKFDLPVFRLLQNIEGEVISSGMQKSYSIIYKSVNPGVFVSKATLVSNVLRDETFEFKIRAVSTTDASVTVTGPIDFCAADEKMFEVTADGDGSYPIYQWFVNDYLFSAGKETTISIPLLQNDDKIKVVLIPSEDGASNKLTVESNSLVASVIPMLEPGVKITSDGDGSEIEKGVPITFYSEIANGGDNPALHWMVNGSPAPSATSPTFTSATLEDGDEVSLVMIPDLKCSLHPNALSNIISIALVTGIDDNQGGVTIHPNPTRGTVLVNASERLQSIQIVDSKGMVLRSYHPGFSIDVSGFPEGLYFFRILVSDKIIFRKIVVRHEL
jgi:trimeric autotransporter adhesin